MSVFADFLDVNGDTHTAVSNVYGGMDIYGSDMSLEATTMPNVYGGLDVLDDSMDMQGLTIPNVHGGVDIYGDDMQFQGMSMPNVFGGEDYMSITGNASDIMSFEDPLTHATDLKLPSFDVSKY